jgi:hypothetical protein
MDPEPRAVGAGRASLRRDRRVVVRERRPMEKALTSPEMVAAVEDAKSFLDMEKTGLVIVEENTVLG